MAQPFAISNYGRQNYFANRGKVHLVKAEGESAYCGVKAENLSHLTSDKAECTCQRCLMHFTATWRKAPTKATTGHILKEALPPKIEKEIIRGKLRALKQRQRKF